MPQFQTNLNLNKNELQNARVHNLSTAPSSPVTGQLYYDTDDNILYYYNGSGWVNPASGVPDGSETVKGIVEFSKNDGSESGGLRAVQDDDPRLTNGRAPTGAAGGVLSGAYPNPGFAADMATQAELDAHITLATDAHDATAISYAGGTGISATNVETAIDELATEKADTASAVMDGDTAGGVLTGTYPNPTFASDMATQTELDAHVNDTSDAHDASAISYAGGTGMSATDVEAAIDELATEKADLTYVDGLAQGVAFKESVRVASVGANVVIASALENGDSLDGITLATGDRVLLKDQSVGNQNGIYTVVASGTASRSLDADSVADLEGAAVFVEEGTVNANSGWHLITDNFTLNTTTLDWTQFSGLGEITAGGGIGKSGNTLSVAAGAGLTQDADGLTLDAAVAVRKYAVDCAASTSTTVTHNLGTRDVTVSVYLKSGTYEEVICDVEHTDTNTVTVRFAVAPSAGAYRIVVHA